VAADPAAPFARATVIKGRIEPHVLDELLGVGKTPDVPDEGPQGKRHHLAHPAQPHDRQELRVGEYFLGDQTAPMLALFLGVAQLQEQAFDDLPLAGRPVAALADLRRHRDVLSQARAFREAHPVVAQIGLQAVTHLGGALDRLAVRVKPVPPFLGLGIRHPHRLGRARQVGLADAHRADLVVVGMRLLELAQLATLQDQRATSDRRQAAHDLEAVAAGLQQHQISVGGVLLGPTGQPGHRHFVEQFLHDGRRRGGTPNQRGRETVRVSVEANHPLDRVFVFLHVIA